jgi:hypothetical protein
MFTSRPESSTFILVNHFEEFGLGRSATVEEIRQAYKVLAQLLHPDRHPDEKLRRVAECQMKRLNETVGILLDPEQRRRYEAEIDGGIAQFPRPPVIIVRQPEPPPEMWWRKITSQSIWCLIAGFALASILWYGFETDRTVLVRPAQVLAQPLDKQGFGDDESRGSNIDAASRITELEQRLARLEKERSAHAAQSQLSSTTRGLTGTWVYDSPRADSDPVAAARHIVLRIDEQTGGTIQGSYTSSSQRLEGTPTTVLAFRFAGKASGSRVQFPWTATGGASGEIQLRLLGPDALEARWWADALGTDSMDTSGAAVLWRHLEP